MNRFYIALGYDCNHDCLNCILDPDASTEFPRISLHRLRDLLGRYAITKQDIIEITGGEPTYDRDEFISLLHFLHDEAGFARDRINVLSNATSFATDEFAQRSAPYFGHIVSTFYSEEAAVHDEVTRRAGSFERELCGLRKLQDMNVVLHIKTLVTNRTVGRLSRFIEFCHENFRDAYVLIAWLDYRGRAWTNRSSLGVTLEEARTSIEEAIELARTKDLRLSVLFPLCLLDPAHWDGLIPRDLTIELDKVVFIDPMNPELLREQPGEEIVFLEKPASCAGCVLRNRCVWEWKEYSREHSLAELRPVVLDSPGPA